MKTSELSGAALDWAVAKCEVGDSVGSFLDGVVPHPEYNNYRPSTDWSQGGAIIERERITVIWREIFGTPEESYWVAEIDCPLTQDYGATPLIAAMRCYVASKLGDEIEVPEGV